MKSLLKCLCRGGCLQEYLAICEEYGVEVTDQDLQNVLAIADEDGEVRRSHSCSRQTVLLK